MARQEPVRLSHTCNAAQAMLPLFNCSPLTVGQRLRRIEARCLIGEGTLIPQVPSKLTPNNVLHEHEEVTVVLVRSVPVTMMPPKGV